MVDLRVKYVKFDNGENYPILINSESELPLFMPTLYMTTMRRAANAAVNTMNAELRAIILLYKWASIHSIDIENRFEYADFLELHEIEAIVLLARSTTKNLSEQYDQKININTKKTNVVSHESFRKTAPKQDQYVSGSTAATRVRNIRDYLDWLSLRALLKANRSGDRYNSIGSSRTLMINAFTARVPKSKNRNTENNREGFDQNVIDHILGVLNPNSPDNPFVDKDIRIRNQLIFIIVLSLGIRRGEALGIKIDDINFQDDTLLIRRRADDPEDTRSDQPNAKTRDRKLPLREGTSSLLREYIFYVRSKVPGAKTHKFLFVTHKPGKYLGKPLSLLGYSKIFRSLRERVPTIPENLIGHNLRHTWNELFSELMDKNDVKSERELMLRSELMGWKPGSDTAQVYTKRHIKKKASEQSIKLQEKIFGIKNNEK